MILRITTILLLILSVVASAFAQGPIRDPDLVRPQPVCITDQPEKITILARGYAYTGSILRAYGDVYFQRGMARLNASDARYDYDTGVGTLKDVVFTTCSNMRPDYRVEAKEITLLPNNKVRARNASLFLGNFRVLTMPSLKFRAGGASAPTNVFPTPGYDHLDGFTLSQNLRMIDNDNFHTVADIRLTTNSGIQGELTGTYGIDGNLDEFPGRFLTYESMRSHVLDLPKRPAGGPCPPEMLEPPYAARLRGFGTFTLKQRTYDINDENLIVYRQPELGLDYIGRQLNFTKTKLDPRIDIYPEITGTWGRYKEVPGSGDFIERRQLTATAGLNVLPLGQSTTVQPVISHTWSTYSNSDFYQQWAYALDASHIFPNASFVSLRYISRNQSGVTPFQFDNVDVFHEMQGAFQLNFSKHTVGLVLGYDFDDEELYSWELMYGWQSDCLGAWVRWSSRIDRLTFNVTLINI